MNLKNFVFELELGLSTETKGGGVNFSAGQKQLLCLARVILRNNKIIMMDEATANVDNETDRVVQNTIKSCFSGCTMLIIAHRLRTIIDSNLIAVIDKGKCEEFGSPYQLYKKGESLFKKMILHTGPEESKFLASRIS